MPLRSEAQRRYMYANHPELAKEFEQATPKDAKLPEHVPQKMDDGGLIGLLHKSMGGDANAPIKKDATDAKAADDIDPVVQGSSEPAKGYAEGGTVDKDEPGIQDATASDFLLPFLLGKSTDAVEALGPKLADEAGSITLGKAAPAMEETANPNEVTAFVKGVQKGAPGTEDVKIYGVKGSPEKLKELFGDEAPGSVPESVLRDKGILPSEPVSIPQDAPNAYAEGGKVERNSLEHPTPNAMMARAMNEGGYPHVTFLENESPAEVKKDTHMEGRKPGPADTTETGDKENPAHMADGGKTPHFLEGLKKGALHKEMGVPEGDKIPAKKLDKAASSDNETLRKRAQFAINAKKWHHAEGGVVPHEEKMKEVYKAMGINKYADGGVSTSDGTVDVSQLPGGGMGTPSPTDPGFWDQIKAALGQVGAPIAGATNAVAAPAEAISSTVAPAVAPAAAGALNNLTGANLPMLPPNAAPAPSLPPPAPLASPVAAATQPPALPVAPPMPADTASGMPNLSTIFNQDTSKLTAGMNPEDRQALANKLQEQQHGIGAVIAQAVAGLGDALAAKGGRDQHSLQNIFSMQKQQRDEALANFDQARQDRLQKVALQTQLGDNALKQAAAQDAYGVDDNLNKMIGAPQGTMKKDLPTYFSLMSAQVARQEKDADLYMKAHTQASTDVDSAVKNASVLGIKPSAAQLQASGQKLADNYYNRAKGNILVKPSDGGPSQWIPAVNINKARQMDPNLQVIPG